MTSSGPAGIRLDIWLQWGHGDFAVDDVGAVGVVSGRSSRFNGATATSPWMTLIGVSRVSYTPGLQWGHGDFAVDDLSDRRRWDGPGLASMGPRRLRRG